MVADLYRLEDFEGELYIRAMISLAKADGVIRDSERDFLEMQARLLGVDINHFLQTEMHPEDIHALSEVTKRVILRDMIELAHIDNDYDERERKRIFQITKLLSVSPSIVEKLEAYLAEYWSLLGKGRQLIEKGY